VITIEKLLPGTWIAVPTEEIEESAHGEKWLSDEIVWAWDLTFNETPTKNMFVVSSEQSKLWDDFMVVTVLAGDKIHQLHIKNNSQFGDTVILPGRTDE
jgi:hypothetical protein